MTNFKFRWQTKDGKTQFAQFEIFGGKLYLETEENSEPIATNVNPMSLSQFVGYDCENKEIYEGDKLVDSNGDEFVAELWTMGVNALDADALEGGLFKFKLKEKK